MELNVPPLTCRYSVGKALCFIIGLVFAGTASAEDMVIRPAWDEGMEKEIIECNPDLIVANTTADNISII
eukprot:428621-Pyramimonas_sp.AAC.1